MFFQSKRLAAAATALVVFPLLSACGNSKEKAAIARPNDRPAASSAPLRFTAIPDENATELAARYKPVAAYLSERLGIDVQYVASSNYGASLEMFKNGDVHLAWFGGLTGVQAHHSVPGARAIAQGNTDPNFMSYFIAHKDSGLEPSSAFPLGMAGKSFTFGSSKSTSGRLMPEHFIRKNTGKSPEVFFGAKPNFSGAHDKTVEVVQSGAFMVGAVNFKVYEKMIADGSADPAIVKLIWKTPTYADYNLTAHPAIDEVFGSGTIDKLQQEVLAMTDKKLLDAFGRDKLIEAENSDFDGVKAVAESLGFLR